jgi:putative transposase
MAEYRHTAQATFDLKYHVLWITKYRYKILRGRVAKRARELIRQVCPAREVVIIRGAVSPDHIHMLLSAAPHLAPAKLAPYIPGRSWRKLPEEFPELRKRYWGRLCGRAGTCARPWARWTSQRSRRTLKSKSGTKMTKG